jgi:hypothetical protein
VITGVALTLNQIPLELIEEYALERRMHDRGGEREVQFLFRDADRLLPVWLDGRLRLLRWGSRRGEPSGLPCTGWTQTATLEAGGWAALNPEEVFIPAALGFDRGIWYRIRQGMRGIVVTDARRLARVYILCEPASHYYEVMTRSPWMPVLVEERI